jgi:hypothetical protein
MSKGKGTTWAYPCCRAFWHAPLNFFEVNQQVIPKSCSRLKDGLRPPISVTILNSVPLSRHVFHVWVDLKAFQ